MFSCPTDKDGKRESEYFNISSFYYSIRAPIETYIHARARQISPEPDRDPVMC